MSKLDVLLITGSIGAGKSNILKTIIENFDLQGFELISTDLYYNAFCDHYTCSVDLKYRIAKEFCYYKLNKAKALGKSFVWETVVASEKKYDFLKLCKDCGYTLTCIYVDTNNSQEQIERCSKRHAEGGYFIPNAKIENSHKSMKENIDRLRKLSDRFFHIDNTVKPMIVSYAK